MPTTTDKNEHAVSNARGWLETIIGLTGRLEASGRGLANDYAAAAREEIEQSVLSVQVRDGWRGPGAKSNGPEEYELLLTTGGPGLRIYGLLDDGCEPQTAELQWQDWFVPWTRMVLEDDEAAAVKAFAHCFYYGE